MFHYVRQQATSDWISSSKENDRNCLWYSRQDRDIKPMIVYSFNHPIKDAKCRENEIQQRSGSNKRRGSGQSAPTTIRKHCRKLFLTSTTSRTGNDGRRRTLIRVLSVVEDRMANENQSLSLSLKPYGGAIDRSIQQQGPFHNGAIPVSFQPPTSSANKKRSGKGKRMKSSTTTRTTPVPEVTVNDSNSNRRRLRRSDGAARRWRTIDVASASVSDGRVGASSVSSSRQTVSRPVAAVDATWSTIV